MSICSPKTLFIPHLPTASLVERGLYDLLCQYANFFLGYLFTEKFSPGPYFTRKVSIPNLSSEKPKNSFSIPSICLNLSPQVLKMIIPTLSTGSHSVNLYSDFQVPLDLWLLRISLSFFKVSLCT